MNFTRALLSLVGVCALVAAVESAPKYSNANKLVEKAWDTVYKLAELKNPEDEALTSPKRNYALLVGFFFDLVHAMELVGAEYNKTYTRVLEKALPTYWEIPQKVGSTLTATDDIFRHYLRPVVKLIDEYCGKYSTAECDKAVDLEVKANPKKYGQPAESLLLAGELAQKYLEDTYEELAINKQIVTFLLTKGINELNYIVSKGIDVLNSFNQRVR